MLQGTWKKGITAHKNNLEDPGCVSEQKLDVRKKEDCITLYFVFHT